jgi:hypothetical protein
VGKIQKFADWLSVKNEIVSRVDVGNEAAQTMKDESYKKVECQPSTERAQFVEMENIHQ